MRGDVEHRLACLEQEVIYLQGALKEAREVVIKNMALMNLVMGGNASAPVKQSSPDYDVLQTDSGCKIVRMKVSNY